MLRCRIALQRSVLMANAVVSSAAIRMYHHPCRLRGVHLLPTPSARCSARFLHTVTTAANFNVEVIQSQQAICLVYYIPSNSGCTAYLKSAERLVDRLNDEAAAMAVDQQEGAAEGEAEERHGDGDGDGGIVIEQEEGGQEVARPNKRKGKTNHWLKLCIINADEHRNLASVFSVERAKLPVTYFIMQGTIVDKVQGQVSEVRLQGILYNFLEHYQKQLNVDLMAKSARRYGESGGTSSPFPVAEKADLLQAGASAEYLKEKVFSSLVGQERIALPEEVHHLDGLRKLIQETKAKAHAELQDLYKQLGMDIRRLSDSEMHKHYYTSKQFTTMGVISALEALFLARRYASVGDISRDNVEWARRAVQKDFDAMLGHPQMRKVLALVDANALKGALQLSRKTVELEMQSIRATLQAMHEDHAKEESAVHLNGNGPHSGGSAPLSSSSASSFAALQQRLDALQEEATFSKELLTVIEKDIDSRVSESDFPAAVVDGLFERLRDQLKKQRRAAPEKEGSPMDKRRGVSAAERTQQLRTVITSLLQLYPTDPKSQTARARLSSLLF